MMQPNSSADALSKFLAANPDTSDPGGEQIDRLGRVLLPAGDGGLSFPEAMQIANLSRPDFLLTLSRAVSAGLVETFDAGGDQKLKLTPAGRSLY